MKVLIACEFSGVVRDAFIAKGHQAMSCDLLPTEQDGPHYEGDIFDVLYDGWDMMVAHPPCDFLAVSGARWLDDPRYPNRRADREKAAEFFMKLYNAPIDKIAVENPVGYMSTYFRKPDQYIQPYWFGFPATKKTGLWLKNLPKLEPTDIVDPEVVTKSNGYKMDKWLYDLSCNQKTRKHERSRTLQVIADQMAAQWG